MSQQAPTQASAIPEGQQPLDPNGGIDLNIPIRAINRSDTPVTWEYARVKYLLQPDQPTFVPYMAMVYYQGDPRAIDLPTGRQQEQYRRNEFARLRILHGVYEGNVQHNSWADIPQIDCYPINSDIPFNTVLRDPEGVNLTEQKRDNSQSQFLQRQLEEMAAQMRVMQGQLAQQQQADGSLAAAGIDPADLDRQAATSKAIAPEEATGQSMVGPSPSRRPPAPKTRTKPGEGPAVTKDGE